MTDLYSSFGACGHQYLENLCTVFNPLGKLQKRVIARVDSMQPCEYQRDLLLCELKSPPPLIRSSTVSAFAITIYY